MTATMLDVTTPTDEFSDHSAGPVEPRYRHLDLRRRVRAGSNVTVVFEDHHTLWFRMHELAWVSRLGGDRVWEQLGWYERLMPGGGRLCATVNVSPRGRAVETDRLGAAVANGRLVLRSDAGHEVIGRYLPQRKTDRLIGLVLWAEFRFPPGAVAALHNPAVEWELAIEAEGVLLDPVRLPESVLNSLSADLG